MGLQTPTAPVETAKRQGERVVHTSGFAWASRAGFVARAAIYLIIGVLALELALGLGGKTTSQQGALETVADQPFGKVLLILVVVGLAGYAVWRLTRAVLGHGPEGSEGGLDRIGAFAGGLVYGGLCVIAVRVLLGSSDNSSGQTHRATAGALGWPAGPWLVAIVGTVLIGIGLYQGYRALSRDFLEHAKVEQMGSRVRDA